MRTYSFTHKVSELDRLYILENAIVNYGGGLVNLVQRTQNAAARLQVSAPAEAKVLSDVARYLHDIALAGELDQKIFRFSEL